ncbi:hypothetical protein FD733_01160 [Pantoea sp. Eser]|nr:hypothetical protein [Pantoea sp. Eser]
MTGGSGLARQWATAGADAAAVVLSGSCSQMTQRQVSAYRQLAPAQEVQVKRCLQDADGYALQLCDWVAANSHQALAPLLFATADAQ